MTNQDKRFHAAVAAMTALIQRVDINAKEVPLLSVEHADCLIEMLAKTTVSPVDEEKKCEHDYVYRYNPADGVYTACYKCGDILAVRPDDEVLK